MPSDDKLSSRESIIKAASHLFYLEGIRAVGVDQIAQRAGVTKKTLYYHFRSKDDLITEYLARRDTPNLAAYEKWFTEAKGDAAARIEAIFNHLAAAASHPKWKGCGFLRTAAELANLPGHPARKIGAAHKKNVGAWLATKLQDARTSRPAELAQQIAVLLDGAFSAMLVHRDAAYAKVAGRAASALVTQARKATSGSAK